MGRVLLAFDQMLHNICCDCTHSRKKGCLHKSLAKMSNIFHNSHLFTIMENTLGKWENCKSTDYLMEYAKLPFEIPDDCSKETFATGIVLSPTEHFFCFLAFSTC